MRNISVLASLLVPFVLLVLCGQGCSRGIEFSQIANQTSGLTSYSGNGGIYDGKLHIFHHYVNNFTCEGRPQPESILIQDNESKWFLIRNTSDKCAFIDQLSVQGVQLDETMNRAIYNGDVYVPPHPYFVNATEDPNLPDVRLEDGVCEDMNGVCSLKASVDQAGVTAGTEAVLIHVPASTYFLTVPLTLLSNSSEGKAITIRGADPLTTIIDGGNSVLPFSVATVSTALVSIENLTIQHGKGNSTSPASAIYPVQGAHVGSQLDVINCILKDSQTFAAIYGGPGSGNIRVLKSQLTGNIGGIQISGVSSLLVENTTIDKNGSGIWLDNNPSSNVIIRKSSISNNSEFGLVLYQCRSCLLENVTVTQNKRDGVVIWSTYQDPSFNLAINNSTIFGNGITAGTNLHVGFYYSTTQLLINNSIVAMNNTSKPNCDFIYPERPQTIIANNSLIDDSSCLQQGSGNILANPQLSPLSDNGGWTRTMSLLTGSPAVDGGLNSLCSSEDQRGLPRPIDKLGRGARCDIGAVESQ